MAGHALARGVTPPLVRGDLSFAVAGPQDEDDICRLLRENPLGGRYSITLEQGSAVLLPRRGRRWPSRQRGSDEGGPDARHNSQDGRAARAPSSALHPQGTFSRKREKEATPNDEASLFIVALDRMGTAVGICERVVRSSFVDGEERALPYIGALRVAESHRHRIGVLRGGFEALRLFAESPGDLPFALTSITSDNTVARRMLTARVPGLPVYHPVGDFSTFALRPRRMRLPSQVSVASEVDFPAIATFLNRENAQCQFAPVWTAADLRDLASAGLHAEHFLLVRDGDRIVGCAAVWDRRAHRRTVVRRYPPLIARLRPLVNVAGQLVGLPHLPPVGAPLQQATLSHLAVAEDCPDVFLSLIAAARDQAARRGFGVLVLGFARERVWRAALLRKHRAMEYGTTLYLAHWPEAAGRVAALKPGVPHPELAFL